MRRRLLQSVNENTEESIEAGDVVYYANNKLNVCKLDNWSTSLGTAIGVIVIPPDFLPDKKARIIAKNDITSDGTATTTTSTMPFSTVNVDTSLTNYTKLPTTDNMDSTSSGVYGNGKLPSDIYTGTQSFVDPSSYYNTSATSNLVPSPYVGDTYNPYYSMDLEGYNNCLSDFNGYENTQVLVALGNKYRAAYACNRYTDGVTSLKWYLPSAGELGFLNVRLKKINQSLTKIGGNAKSVDINNYYWSSTEYGAQYAFFLNTSSGGMGSYYKTDVDLVRPFATIDLQ